MELVTSDAIREDPERNKEKELEEFFALITIDPETEAEIKKAVANLAAVRSNILRNAFLDARSAVVEVGIDSIDDTMGKELAINICRKVDIRLPYFPEQPWYPLMKEKMLEAFEASAWYHFFTESNKEKADEIVTGYLNTRYTYTPRNG